MPSRTEQERVIAGRYALSEQLGSGGMGVVWRAHDEVLGRDVAIKEVSIPHEIPDKERSGLYTRAMREARAAARLGHPNSVTVFDVHEEDGRPYIVMEYVVGETLQEIVRTNGPLEPDETARVGLAVLDALQRAHKTGIVHRDVKPGNIMVTDDGTVKLADFGIAAVKDDPRITQTGMVLGSPAYLAPEQARGEEASAETDLWSLGASLYFAVEGEPPFEGGNAVATVDAVVHEPPRQAVRAQALCPAIDRLLEKDPAKRPSYSEARKLLQDAASGGSGAAVVQDDGARTHALGASPVAAPETSAPARSYDSERPERTGRAAWWVAALLVLAAAAVAGLLLWPGTDEEPTTEAGAKSGRSEKAAGGGQSEGSGGGGEDTTEPVEEESAPVDEVAEEGTVPADWTTYTDPQSGYTISHPPEWEILVGRSGPTNTDFRDPATGAYMRVAWRSPPDPAGAVPTAQGYEPEFAARHESEGYELVAPLEAYEYRDYDAVWWEYTYGGHHAVNLQFVTGDFGFALNFQAPEESWDDLQDEFEAFQASFQPPS